MNCPGGYVIDSSLPGMLALYRCLLMGPNHPLSVVYWVDFLGGMFWGGRLTIIGVLW